MKEIILYAYHIEVENLKEYKEYSVFEYQKSYFYFTKLKRNEKEFQELLDVMLELERRNLQVFPFMLNVNHTFITMVENTPYVLIKVDKPTKEYGIYEIIAFQNNVRLNAKNSSLYRNEWANLWSEKVDYLEYQVHELGKNYPIILNSFSYFIGLAETAICYVKYIEKRIPTPKNLPIVLSHKRVNYPNIRLNFDNPLNFIFDIEVRDIASYIKSMFFEEKESAFIDLKAYIDLKKPDLYNITMLYARLIYPSYYFDLHEKIIHQDEKEEKLLPIIDSVDDYLDFLKRVWQLFREYVPIEPIPWILKKES